MKQGPIRDDQRKLLKGNKEKSLNDLKLQNELTEILSKTQNIVPS